jgi:hypothetical protein
MIERLLRRWLPILAAVVLSALLLQGSTARAGSGSLRVSGSVSVDYWGIGDRTVGPKQPEGMGLDASLTIGGDVHEDLSYSVKTCFSCHGMEPEHVMVDYQPKPWFNVQAGRLTVPFGDFSNRVDPGSHALSSAPLIYDMGHMAYGSRTEFNLGIIPLPYVDTGVLVYGQTWLGSRLQLWYGGYAVTGMRGSNDVDFVAMRSLYYTDNNNQPAPGGRATLTYSAEPGEVFGDASIGASATRRPLRRRQAARLPGVGRGRHRARLQAHRARRVRPAPHRSRSERDRLPVRHGRPLVRQVGLVRGARAPGGEAPGRRGPVRPPGAEGRPPARLRRQPHARQPDRSDQRRGDRHPGRLDLPEALLRVLGGAGLRGVPLGSRQRRSDLLMLARALGLAAALALLAGEKADWDPRDDGPDKLDVSEFPVEQQRNYEVAAVKCAKCHPLSRTVNSHFSAGEWKRYMKKMIRRPNSGVNEEQAAKIYEFLKFKAVQDGKD